MNSTPAMRAEHRFEDGGACCAAADFLPHPQSSAVIAGQVPASAGFTSGNSANRGPFVRGTSAQIEEVTA